MAEGKTYDYQTVTFMYNGTRHFCRGKTLEEAIEKKLIKLRALENGEIGITKNMTVSRWADEWLKTYKKGNVTDKVYKDYESKLRRLIAPVIGNMKLRDVTDVKLQQILIVARDIALTTRTSCASF